MEACFFFKDHEKKPWLMELSGPEMKKS